MAFPFKFTDLRYLSSNRILHRANRIFYCLRYDVLIRRRNEFERTYCSIEGGGNDYQILYLKKVLFDIDNTQEQSCHIQVWQINL